MLVVLAPNVLVSAALSPAGPPAELIRRWLAGEFELVVSPALLAELERGLAYPKIARRITPPEAASLVELLKREAQIEPDPVGHPSVEIEDPEDEYLLALAADAGAALVSGDKHLTVFADRFPVYSPRDFLDEL